MNHGREPQMGHLFCSSSQTTVQPTTLHHKLQSKYGRQDAMKQVNAMAYEYIGITAAW
jgi:hypothetical protein